MNPADRRKLNQKIKALQYRLCISDDNFIQIVMGVEPRSGGHLTHIGDEEANLVMVSLRRISDRTAPSPRRRGQGEVGDGVPSRGGDSGVGSVGARCPRPSIARQNRMVARLMDYLNWRWSNTASLCKRMTGKPRTDKCTSQELSKIIRAMVAIIDGDIAAGKITLSDEDRRDYFSHTTKFRKQSPSPDPSPLERGPRGVSKELTC